MTVISGISFPGWRRRTEKSNQTEACKKTEACKQADACKKTDGDSGKEREAGFMEAKLIGKFDIAAAGGGKGLLGDIDGDGGWR